jgi:hypothetical protein
MTYDLIKPVAVTGDYSLPLQSPNFDGFDEFEETSDVDEDSLLSPSTRRPTRRLRKCRICGPT